MQKLKIQVSFPLKEPFFPVVAWLKCWWHQKGFYFAHNIHNYNNNLKKEKKGTVIQIFVNSDEIFSQKAEHNNDSLVNLFRKLRLVDQN